ncbi:MAG: DNA-directed RNA polymerase subunit omega [bacterium]|jgi:DNA-directed RNA polymerase subunit K/omega|nr:DNA-directed RNA polymerase subunit omega [bacterium]
MRIMHDTTKEDLEQRNQNVYEAILVMGLRARQVNEHQKSILSRIHEEYQATLNLSEDAPEEPEEIELPAFTKPTVQAMREMLDGKTAFDYLDPVDGESR